MTTVLRPPCEVPFILVRSQNSLKISQSYSKNSNIKFHENPVSWSRVPRGRTDRQRDRQTGRETVRERDRQTGRERDRQGERQTYRKTGRETDRQKERERDRQTERERETDRETDRQRDGQTDRHDEAVNFRNSEKRLKCFSNSLNLISKFLYRIS